MDNMQVIEVQGMRVLTTKQIAEAYETDTNTVGHNFRRNKEKYTLGKHYLEIQGEELKELKSRGQIVPSLKQVKHLYLWTEKGALLHAKSINTDKAWEVYENLVDFYFRVKDASWQQASEEKAEIVPVQVKVEPIRDALPDKTEQFELPKMKNPIRIFRILLQLADQKDIEVDSFDFKHMSSALYDGCIGIRLGLPLERVIYELAFELSHALIHSRYGDMVKCQVTKECNMRADKTARMMIELLNIKTS